SLVVLGWMMEIMRRTGRGEAPSLPDFDDMGGMFMDGLRASVIAIVWSLLVALIVTLMSLGTIFLPEFFGSEDEAALAIVAATMIIVGLVFVFLIPMLILMPPALGHLVETGNLREALKPGTAIRVFRANPGGFLLATLLSSLANMVLGSLGAILCLIGIYPASVIWYGLNGQLLGKAYYDAKENLRSLT
ncbi:MAG TPA: DUF4013 domain-containing protein, partial [Nitrospiraceae bacterium]|nr:DUF4013 domain-containing protein [Nitrospiraceae bacterium]